jgi:hypothetical protein
MLRRRSTQSAGLRWPARAGAVWAVLAGLFLMHGAASPAGACCGGTPVTAMTAMTATAMTVAPGTPAVSAAALASGDLGASHVLASCQSSASPRVCPRAARFLEVNS